MEPQLESVFHEDSYGYRPNKSAIDAIGKARQRCWKYDYVIEFDIKGLFDNIDHELLMKAVKMHVKQEWAIMYIERWLKAPFSKDGIIEAEKSAGTSQGGVISPVLANLFMHYAFDIWMKRENVKTPFERYADDAIIHCKTEKEAKSILEALNKRMNECRLELHPEKTKIVYCKDKDRQSEYKNTQFDFLGYTFKPTFIKDRTGRLQWNFLPSVSGKAAKAFRQKIREMKVQSWSGSKVEMVAEKLNPMIRGWLNYFTKFMPSAVKYTMDCINQRLTKWAMCKYKRFRGRYGRAKAWLQELGKREPKMFAHWAIGWMP